MNQYIKANGELAIAQGWHDFEIEYHPMAGSIQYGTPPEAIAMGIKCKMVVPDWCGDWKPASELLIKLKIVPEWKEASVVCTAQESGLSYEAFYKDHTANYKDHVNAEWALRYAIVQVALLCQQKLLRKAA